MAGSNRMDEWFKSMESASDKSASWNMENVHDFSKWVSDNKAKSDEGCEAMQAVMSIGTDVASAACIKRFRDRGREQAEVAGMTNEICDRIIAACRDGREDVVADCARLFAGTCNVALVMMMAFVCYSLIGVKVADELIDG